MSKKKARRKQKHGRPERKGQSGRKVMVVAAVALSLGMTGVILARWRAARVAHNAAVLTPAAAPVPSPVSPASPSKEYVYAGGRLLATEEPQPPAPGPYSLSLGGAGDYAQAPYSASLDINGPVTLEAWVKINATGAYQSVVARESAGVTGGGGGYELTITDTGKVRLNIWTTPTTYVAVIGATALSTGVWHHVAAVSDGSQRRVYLDGTLDASATGSQVPAAGSAGLKIGRRSSSTNYPFNGLIDEVRVSNAALYSANFTPPATLTSGASTKGLWKFTDQSPADGSTNGNNVTLQGGAAYSADVP